MAQKKTLQEQFPLERTTKIDDVWLTRLLRVLEARISGIELKSTDFDEATAELLTVGLARINEIILPALGQVTDLVELGFLIAPSQTPALLVEGATTVFTIPPGSQRDIFIPSTFVMLTRDANLDDYAVMRTVSYDKEFGEYTGTMVSVHGDPGPFADWTLGALAGSAIAQLQMLADSKDARDTAVAAAGVAVEKAEDAVDAAEEATGAIEQFRKNYIGARSSDPSVDGNGDPVVTGAMYTNTITGKLRFYSSGMWADATAASNITVHSFTTDGRTAPYPLPEAPTSNKNCFVILGGVPQMKDAFTTDAATLSFTEWPVSGIRCEVTIIGQLAIGTPSDESITAPKLTSSTPGLKAIRDKLKIRSMAEEGFLAPFRNKIINGDFSVMQRLAVTNFTVGTGILYHGPDRWYIRGTNLTGGAISGQTFRSAGMPWKGSYLRLVRAGVTAAQYIGQKIENLEQFSGKRVTLSFATSFDAAENVEVTFEGNYGTGGSPSAIESFSVQAKLIPQAHNGITRYVCDIPDLTAKTFGSNLDSSLAIRIAFLGTNNTTLRIGRISLVEGDLADDEDPFVTRPPQIEEMLCKRYFERIAATAATFAIGYVRSASTARWALDFQKKRAIPTITLSPPATFTLFTTAGIAVTSMDMAQIEAQRVLISLYTTGLTQGQALQINSASASTATVDIDAEL